MDYQSKAEAEVAAYKLRDKMKTKGWKIHVWENLGWHFHLRRRHGLTVSPTYRFGKDPVKYSCLLGDDSSPGTGFNCWLTHSHHADPNKAVEEQLEVAKAYVVSCMRIVDKAFPEAV